MTNVQAHYIRLYKAADEILKQPDNPCQIQQSEDGAVSCVKSREGWVQHNTLCCSGCRHLGPEGCTAMSLSCKLGWCYTSGTSIKGMDLKDHPTFEAIYYLRKEAELLGVPLRFRHSYKETFGA
jgi:hypothetical protein